LGMSSASERFIPTRRSLLNRLKNWDDQEGWKEFFDTYWRLIYGVARKAGLVDAEAQDVVQETIIAVAKNMPGFDYDPAIGSFKNWLLRLTRWRITDQLRKKLYERSGQRFPREEHLTTSLVEKASSSDSFDLEKAWNEEWEKNLLEIALDRVKTQVSARHYQLFHLHVIQNVDARMVARRLRVKLAEVYYAKYKISSLAKREIKALESKMG